MFRLRVVAWILSTCGFLAWSADAMAQDLKSPPAKKAPAGLRLAGGGNSWYAENCEPYTKEAGIQGHQFLRTIHQHAQRAPGDTRPKPLELAEKGGIDAFVWGHTDGFGGAAEMLLDILEVGLKKNPNFKVYIQVPWLVHDGRNPAPADIDYGDSDLADVQAKLRSLVVDGKFPGVTKQSELFPDDMPHAGRHVGMLAGYCHFAAMYHILT